MTSYVPPRITDEGLVHYKFAILAATGLGPNVERSIGRPLIVRSKKADALARALPEPERAAVEEAFARYRNIPIS